MMGNHRTGGNSECSSAVMWRLNGRKSGLTYIKSETATSGNIPFSLRYGDLRGGIYKFREVQAPPLQKKKKLKKKDVRYLLFTCIFGLFFFFSSRSTLSIASSDISTGSPNEIITFNFLFMNYHLTGTTVNHCKKH